MVLRTCLRSKPPRTSACSLCLTPPRLSDPVASLSGGLYPIRLEDGVVACGGGGGDGGHTCGRAGYRIHRVGHCCDTTWERHLCHLSGWVCRVGGLLFRVPASGRRLPPCSSRSLSPFPSSNLSIRLYSLILLRMLNYFPPTTNLRLSPSFHRSTLYLRCAKSEDSTVLPTPNFLIVVPTERVWVD